MRMKLQASFLLQEVTFWFLDYLESGCVRVQETTRYSKLAKILYARHIQSATWKKSMNIEVCELVGRGPGRRYCNPKQLLCAPIWKLLHSLLHSAPLLRYKVTKFCFLLLQVFILEQKLKLYFALPSVMQISKGANPLKTSVSPEIFIKKLYAEALVWNFKCIMLLGWCKSGSSNLKNCILCSGRDLAPFSLAVASNFIA